MFTLNKELGKVEKLLDTFGYESVPGSYLFLRMIAFGRVDQNNSMIKEKKVKSIDLAKMKKKILQTLDPETGRLEERLTQIKGMRTALVDGIGGGPVSGNGRKKPSNGRKKHHTMSMAGRRAIAKAQRLRWRKIREEKS